MTRRPIESHDVQGHSGEHYELNILCAAPACMERAGDKHHIWRRSFLGGAYGWVILPDGSQVGNIVSLCRPHHTLVTDDKVNIKWDGVRYLWSVPDGIDEPLAFQPPHVLADTFLDDALAYLGVPTEPVTDEEGDVSFEHLTFRSIEQQDEHDHTPVKENECPACHQALPKPKVDKPAEEKRPRRTWSITVPVDERENGAEILDTLLEAARTELAKAGVAYGDAAAARYFVLSAALGLFVQHFDSVVSEA